MSEGPLQKAFEDPVSFNSTDDGLFYRAPVSPGYAKMRPETLRSFQYPHGEQWASDPAAQKQIEREEAAARKILRRRDAGGSTARAAMWFALGASVAVLAMKLMQPSART